MKNLINYIYITLIHIIRYLFKMQKLKFEKTLYDELLEQIKNFINQKTKDDNKIEEKELSIIDRVYSIGIMLKFLTVTENFNKEEKNVIYQEIGKNNYLRNDQKKFSDFLLGTINLAPLSRHDLAEICKSINFENVDNLYNKLLITFNFNQSFTF